MGRPKGEPSQRFRFTVPDKDLSVIEWARIQSDLSMSLRMLVKEDIMRNGCTDVTCRTVGQLPRRGRPPLSEARGEDGDAREAEERPVQAQEAPVVPSERPAVREHAPRPEPVRGPVKAAEDRKDSVEPVGREPAENSAPKDDHRGSAIEGLLSGGSGTKTARKPPSALSMGILDE